MSENIENASDKKEKKKKKKDDWDPGITVAPMNGDELPKFRRLIYLNRKRKQDEKENDDEKKKYSKDDKRAIIRGGLLAMLPYLAIALVGFGIAALLVWLWLR